MDTPAPRRRFDVVAYLKLFRFPLVFTAIADSAAGYLSLNRGTVEPWILALLAGTSAGLYLFGMALNDIADVDRDRQIAPTRVLPSGRLRWGQARLAAVIVLGLSFQCVMWLGLTGYGLQILIPWTAAVVFIAAYDLGWMKVPPTMGLVRLSNFLLGASIFASVGYEGHRFQPALLVLAGVPVFIYVTGLTYVSTLEDQEGARVRLWVGLGIMLLGTLFAASPFLSTLSDYSGQSWGYRLDGALRVGVSPLALGTAAVLAAWLVFRARAAKDRKGIMLMVRDGIGGIILLESTVVASGTEDPVKSLAVAGLVIPAVISVAIFKKLA